MASESTPLVSVGMFLYNESAFVAESVSSILAQDYDNLDIIISDNASSDNTAQIVSSIIHTDPRARFEQQSENIGATANCIRVLECARGKYFIWAAGHDLWDSDMIRKCVDTLEANQSATIAYASSRWIDSNGHSMNREAGWYDTRGMDPILRFFMAFFGNMHPVLGVIRTDALRALPKIHACAGTDLIILAELAVMGHFIHVVDTGWSRRQPRSIENHKQRTERYISKEFGLTSNWIDRRFPLFRLPIELIRVVHRAQFPLIEKICVWVTLLPAFLVRYLAGRKA